MEANKRDHAALVAIRRLTIRQGWPPTVRELAAELGLASSDSAQRRILRLTALGWVEKGKGPRALRVSRLGFRMIEGAKI